MDGAEAVGPVPLLPGVATATELMRGLELGFTDFKFFPAVPAGGVAVLKAFAPVFPQVRFCPTGGVSLENAPQFLGLANVVCAGATHEPPTQTTFASPRNWGAFSSETPPVGQNLTCGKTGAKALSIATPPAGTAGKNFRYSNPAAMAAITSVAVATPGKSGTGPSRRAPSASPGLTANFAPASAQRSRSRGFSTVPAPGMAPSTSWAMRRMAPMAAGVRRVTSSIGRPPATRARPSGTAWASSSMVSTGTTGARVSISCRII